MYTTFTQGIVFLLLKISSFRNNLTIFMTSIILTFCRPNTRPPPPPPDISFRNKKCLIYYFPKRVERFVGWQTLKYRSRTFNRINPPSTRGTPCSIAVLSRYNTNHKQAHHRIKTVVLDRPTIWSHRLIKLSRPKPPDSRAVFSRAFYITTSRIMPIIDSLLLRADTLR